MDEQEVKIPISASGLFIYGTLRGSYSKPLIVLCHGYGGWMHDMLLYNGARYFEDEGFSTLRLSMYGGGENSRNISESDVITHANDIDEVVSFIKSQGVDWVGIAGHSYSGMAIVYSEQQDFNAAVLWDPTHTDGYETSEAINNLKNDFMFVDSLNLYVSGIGPGYVYAKTVFDNDYPKSNEMAAKFNAPACVINASWSKEQKKYGKLYVDNFKGPSKQIIIPDSTHPFTGSDSPDKLFKATAEYFKNFLL